MPDVLALVVNPTSGKGRGARVRDVVVDRLRSRGVAVRELAGRDADEALDLCRAAVAGGCDVLAAVGGDGMAHIALQAVAGTPVALGLVPAGTGNDLALSLGVSGLTPVQAADVLVDGRRWRIDAARSGDRWFGCVLGAGFDSVVNERANRMRRPRGDARYVLAMLAELPRFRPVPFRLTLDGEAWDTEAMLVAVGNASSYGGGMKVTPDARLDDGLLDVLVLGAMSKPRFLRAFPRVYKGTHVSIPAVTIRRARVVGLASAGVVAYADGERFGDLPLTVECIPGAVEVMVP